MVDSIRMSALRTTLLSAFVLLLVLPASALARPKLEPLRDAVPLGSHFKDRVFTSSSRTASVAQSGTWKAYPIKDGKSVQAAISDRYANQLDTHVVQTYVDFLDGLNHGPELSQLKMYIAPPDEVLSECG